MRNDDLRQSWGDFIDEVGERKGGWDWFATLTYRDRSESEAGYNFGGWNKIGIDYARKSVNQFLDMAGDLSGMRDIHWFRAAEYDHNRGVPHWHILLGNMKDALSTDAWGWWYRDQGFARILKYDERLGARFYLCKYITKSMGDIEFSPNLDLAQCGK